jgi:hypothetical protein
MLILRRVASRIAQVWSQMQKELVQKVWVGFSSGFSARGGSSGRRTANGVAWSWSWSWSWSGPSVVGGPAYVSFSFSFTCQAHQQLGLGLNCVGAVKGVAQHLPRWTQS